MIGSRRASSVSRATLIAGTSIVALSAAASLASAQCAPDPTIANGTTICSGTDANGLVVTTPSTIVVAADATVLKGAAQAGAIALSSSAQSSTIAILNNNGTISAPGGTALVALNNPGRVGFSSITNAAGATIAGSAGAVNVWFGRLTNAGTIDGGTGSAIAFPGTETSVFPSAIVNSGSIVSNGAAATLDLTASTPQQFSNSGRIINAGTGLAIDAGSRSLNLVNASGGVIGSGGLIAVRSTFQVSLTNAGTINGGIVGGDGFPDRIDTRAGIVNGSIMLNGGDDRLITTIGQNMLIENVTGAVDGGTGTDLLELIVGQNRVLTDVTLPTNFEVLQLDLVNDATLTLAAQPPAGGYFVRGNGTVVVGTDLTTTAGPAISNNYVQENLGLEELRFVNDRAVTATLTRSFDSAVALRVTTAVNSGTITASNGNGVSFQKATSDLLFTNSGTIVATNTGAIVGGVLQNTGTIRSLTGTAVSNDLGGGGVRADTSTNSGVVDGVTTGYGLSSLVLVNSGRITASNGVGLAMSGATLDNRVGGIVSGTQAAIRSDGFFENYVANAGTINGNVDFGSASSSSSARDWFIDRGGTVNGDVRMGGGNDVFVTDLARPSSGVTGTIDGGTGFDIFRYRTSVNAQAVIAPRATFEGVGYEVAGGAKLTLTSPTALTVPLSFAGTGTIDVAADVSGDGGPLIDASTLVLPLYSGLGDSLPVNALSIVSRGTLTAASGPSASPAVAYGTSTSNFENAGTINAGSTAFAAVRSWNSVINSGTILLNGNYAVTDADSLINSGTIRTATGATASNGTLDVRSVTNSGMINVTGIAISLPNAGTVSNSGVIVSTGDAAITGNGTVDNLASGTISGSMVTGAVQMSGGRLANAGAIIGSVDMGYTSFGQSFASGTYVANGGTIAGNLTFGSGTDTLIVTGSTTGVSGTIDGGAGIDTITLDKGSAGAAMFAGASNFERLTVANGNWTLTGPQTYSRGTSIATGTSLTATAPAFGSNVSNSGALIFDQGTSATFAGTITGTGTVTKAGAGTLTLGAQTYTGATTVTAGTLALTGSLASTDLTVASGAILTSALGTTLTVPGNLTVTNAGTILSTNATGRAINVSGGATVRTITINNKAGGMITSGDDAIRINVNPTGGTIVVNNSGTIQTTNGGQALDFDAAASGGASIVINNYAGGVIQSFGQDAIRPGQGAIVTNAGLIRSDGAANNNYDGVDWQAKTGVVVNAATGTISGLRHGITSDTAVDVTNYGLIQGRNGSGVGSDGTGVVTNYGTITGAWDGIAINGDGDGVDIDRIGTVRNFGTIRGLSASGVDSGGQPNGAEGIAIGGGRIENAAGAIIAGASRGILVDDGSAGSAYGATTIVNAGTIQGGTSAAITLVGAFDDMVVNSGSIVGGSIGSAIDLGAGNDILALMPGSSITGRVDGGAGNDQVILAGSGTGSFAGAVNFERLDVASGNWTLTAASNFVNGTGIAAGATLAGTTTTLTGAVADAGTLRIDQTVDGVFGATLAGTGSLVKAGTASVVIGNQTGFTGATSIQSGRLLVAGTLPSAVTVQSGGTLGGSGTVASATVASGGTIAPGASIGTLSIAGNFVQQAGSTYAAEIDAAGLSDRIIVGGTATLQPGAQLAISGTAGPIGTRYTLLAAAGGVTGTYAVTQSGAGSSELRFGYTGTAVVAQVARTGTGLLGLARTTNQTRLAAAFAPLGVGNAAYAALTLVPDGDTVTHAFDLLTGEVHASLRAATVHDAQIVQGIVVARTLAGDQPSGLWGTLLGNSGDDDGSSDAAAVHRHTFGGIGGFDIGFGDGDAADGRVGVAGGYTRTKLAVDARASDATAKAIHLLGYAGGSYGAIRVRAGLGYAWTDNRTDRFVAFPGFTDRLRGDYDGSTAHSYAEAGYAVPFGGGSVEPFGAFQAFRVRTDGFAEIGGVSALTVAKRTESFAFASAGLRFDTPIVDGLSARGVGAWQRRVEGVAPSNVARFAAGGGTFDIVGVPLSRDAVTAGIDLVWAPAANIRLTSSYAGVIGSRSEDSTFRLSASIGF